MRRILAVLVVLSFILSGCSLFSKKNEPQVTPKNNQKEQQQNQLSTEEKSYFIGSNSPVTGLKEWVDRYKPYEGVFMQKKGNYRVILISQGVKYSKGYTVSIENVANKDNKWVVETTIKRPAEEDFSGAEVYPNEVLTIMDDGKPVEVVKTKSSNSEMAVKLIEIPEGSKLAVSKNFIVLTPLEGEKVSSPLTIKGKARVFEATFRISIEDGHNRLADKTITASQGAPGWGDFDLSLPFETPTSPNGTIILSYENMENGEIIEELLLPVKFQE